MAEYSKNEVKQAGNILRAGNCNAADRQWAEEVLTYWRSLHSYPINTFQATLREKLKGIDSNAIVAQRLKRAPSIVQKLKRFPQMQLTKMQDVAGLRAIVKDIKKVRELENNYRYTHFLHKLVGSKDYISDPKDTGYRGIHLIYKYRNAQCTDYDNLFLELQFRTKLQHAWATAVETMGTFLEHSLKSSEGPKEWLNYFSIIASAFALIEKCPPVPQYKDFSIDDTYGQAIRESDRLDVASKLNAFSIAANHIHYRQNGSYHLVVLDIGRKAVEIKSYGLNRLEQANEDYTNYEREIFNGRPLQVVLVSTGSIALLRRAYPNYFFDTAEFIKNIEGLRKKTKKDPYQLEFSFD